MTYSRGDIVTIWFADNARQTVKRRPAVVVQSDAISGEYDDVIIAPFTTQMRRSERHFPLRIDVVLRSREHHGTNLPVSCVLLIDRLTSIKGSAVADRIGVSPPILIARIDTSLRTMPAL